MTPGHVVLQTPNGRLRYRFHARDVNLIMGSGEPGRGVGTDRPVSGRVIPDS